MRTLFRVLTGFIFATLAAAVTQVLFAFPPTATGDAAAWAQQAGMWALAAATHIAIFSFLFAFLAIAIAEWQGVGAWAYYVLTGMAIAIGGFFAQYATENASQPTIFNNYALVAFISAGSIGGFVYWLIAGRRAAAGRGDAKIAVGDDDATTAHAPDQGGNNPGSGGDAQAPQRPMTSVPTTRPLRSTSPLRVSRPAPLAGDKPAKA